MAKEQTDRNYTDGQYFELIKRLIDKQYIDPAGNPALRSDQLVRPRKVGIVKSAGARWTRFYINRAVYLFSADGRRVDYVSGEHPGDVSAASPSPWNSSVSGVCKLFTAGEWHVKTPLISTDVEGDMMSFIETDAANGVGMDVSAAEIAGAVAAGDITNLIKIGGTNQSGVDVAADYAALTLSKVASPTAIGATSTTIFNSSTTRRYLYIRNLEAVGGKYFSLAFGAVAAVLGEGFTLYPGEGRVFRYQSGSTQEVRAIASSTTPAYEAATGVN